MADSLAEAIDPRFFEHGGRLDVARLAYKQAPEPWIDLSTGISPWSYPPPSRGEDNRALPDAGTLQALIAAARLAYRAPAAADIVALPGTDLGLSLVPWLFRTPQRVAILVPAYSGHRAAWEAAGHSVAEINSLDRLGSAAVLVVVNPGNPDGRFIRQSELAAVVPQLRRRDGLLLVDEAFADADEGHSLLPAVTRLDLTLVLRSFGKFYGAAGVRLGFAITSHPIAARLKAALGAWPVSTHAIQYGRAALEDAEWAAAQRLKLKAAAADLDAMLAGAGFRPIVGTALFRIGEHVRSRSLFVHLANRGILTRPYRDRSALRFGLPGSEEERERLIAALRSFSP